jgi:DNA-binding transcriptional MocR family regulator
VVWFEAVAMHIALYLDPNSKISLQMQIYEQLATHIREGRLRPGGVLPSSRDLSKRLGVSRNTISEAYEKLVADGYINTAPARVLSSARPRPKTQCRHARDTFSTGQTRSLRSICRCRIPDAAFLDCTLRPTRKSESTSASDVPTRILFRKRRGVAFCWNVLAVRRNESAGTTIPQAYPN